MSKLKNPEVRINYSWLLKNDISEKVAKLNRWKLESDDQFEEWAENYRKAWAKKEKTILAAMQEITGLEFYLPVIDIAIAPYIIPKSQPLIISFMDTPEVAVETITHELTHTLLCDNRTISLYGENRDFMLGTEWQKLFGFEDDFNAVVHVPVHAVCQKVFEDYLGDERYVARDKQLMKKFGATSYLKSWEYVEQEGADVIIEKLKKSYAEITKKLEKKR